MSLDSVFWLAALIVFLILEGVTVSLVSIWFAVGAVAAMLLSLFNHTFWVQALVFALVSAAALACLRPLTAKLRRRATVPTNGDRNIGRVATVLEPIAPGRTGRVRLDGVDWAARGRDGVTLEAGARCRVFDIQSTVLIVEPQPETAVL